MAWPQALRVIRPRTPKDNPEARPTKDLQLVPRPAEGLSFRRRGAAAPLLPRGGGTMFPVSLTRTS